MLEKPDAGLLLALCACYMKVVYYMYSGFRTFRASRPFSAYLLGTIYPLFMEVVIAIGPTLYIGTSRIHIHPPSSSGYYPSIEQALSKYLLIFSLALSI